jgi:hypothetical protein
VQVSSAATAPGFEAGRKLATAKVRTTGRMVIKRLAIGFSWGVVWRWR